MSAKTTKNKDRPEEKTRYKCWIIGGGFAYIKLMYSLGCDGAKGLNDADFILFTGGEDVNPELYGEVAMPKTNFSRQRDEFESAIYHQAVERGIPMVGICRGGQFLNVKNGGKLWQHVTHHCGSHLAEIEVPPFVKDRKRVITVTSTHHQMMIPTDDAIILATAKVALEKHSPGLTRMGKDPEHPDIEVVAYDDTNSLCFQPHPEMGGATPDCVDFFEECLENWIYPRIPNETAKAIMNQSQGSTRVC